MFLRNNTKRTYIKKQNNHCTGVAQLNKESNQGNVTNRLAREKSPYLQQHAHDPVNWYPWDDEAFRKAREEDKPIFLSIGYSTCHWCHVMKKESFQDESVAKLLNDSFVSIKVDREERPDIDSIYMSVCQAINGRGGWPLTILMTPDRKPFYAATYIPRESHYGIPGMKDIIPAISDLWLNKKDEIINSANDITTAIASSAMVSEKTDPNTQLDENVLHRTFQQLHATFDQVYAGFGRAPKFPTPHNLMFLLRYWKRTGNASALDMVESTLSAMRVGGIYDHIGYGFHRYSTDRQWLVPHFEKMLYDQALMIIVLAETYQATGNIEYSGNARQILSYLKRDMLSEQGAFFSAEDADSEGEEGKFYLWEAEEIDNILGKDSAGIFKKLFNITKEGNFIEEHNKKVTGKNIPHMIANLSDSVENSKHTNSIESTAESIESSRQKLFNEREKRIHPSKDDKILTDWNGLTIVALCKAAQAFNEDEYAKMAEIAADFFLEKMVYRNGKIMHMYKEGEAGVDAFLEDYAFFTWGLLELYHTVFRTEYLEHAIKINNYMLAHFHDNINGGFYHTSTDAEELIFRNKEVYDGAIPSGNSVCIMNILRIATITADPELEGIGLNALDAFAGKVNSAPAGYTYLMTAADTAINGSVQIIVAGDHEDAATRDIISLINERFIPEKIVLLIPENKNDKINDIAPYTKGMKAIDGKPAVHICKEHTCERPLKGTHDIVKNIEALSRY